MRLRKNNRGKPKDDLWAQVRKLECTGVPRTRACKQLGVSRSGAYKNLGPSNFNFPSEADPLSIGIALWLGSIGFTFQESANVVGETRNRVAGWWQSHLSRKDFLARSGLWLRKTDNRKRRIRNASEY